jgi:hypothetical protein
LFDSIVGAHTPFATQAARPNEVRIIHDQLYQTLNDLPWIH